MASLATAGHVAGLSARALAAEVVATAGRLPGHRFGLFGRAAGLRLMANGMGRTGARLLLDPVSSVRYWEFDFADRALAGAGGRALDVSSPRILALYLAHRRRFASIRMTNPDRSDLEQTESIVRGLGVNGIETDAADAVAAARQGPWDAIWSVSVVEHIDDDGDSRALAALSESLRPGGVLVVTVPVDRHHRDEYRADDAYGLGTAQRGSEYFFQRYYDGDSVRRRLLDAVQMAATSVEWFGETTAGVFGAYERQWMAKGIDRTIDDPAFIARHFRRYPTWADMPGMGVCGMAFRAPARES